MKNKFLFFFFIFFVSGIFSPLNSQNWIWGRGAVVEVTRYAEGVSVAADDSGAVYFAGNFDGDITFGSITLFGSGADDGFLVKYDTAGNLIWAKKFGGLYSDFVYSVSTDHSGNIFLIGDFASPTFTIGTTTLVNSVNNGNSSDIFIAKYDAAGNLIYAVKEGGTGNDCGYSIAEDNLGNSYFTGIFQSPSITFGSTTITNPGSGDNFYLAKIDASGNALWGVSAYGYYGNGGLSVAADPSGNTFVTGYFESYFTIGTNTFNNPYSGTYDLFVAAYDPSGNCTWAQAAGGSAGDVSNSVAIDSADNVYLTGSFVSPSISFGTTNLLNYTAAGGVSDIFFAKLNSAGNFLWAKSAGGSSMDRGESVATDANGNVYFTGGYNSSSLVYGADTLSSYGGLSDPMYLLTCDGDGNLHCFSSLASGGDDLIGLAADHYGNVYVGADFAPANFTVGNDTLVCVGLEAPFVAKYRCEDPVVAPRPLQPECTIYIPNAFSPNNDGQNDFECVRSNCIQSMHFSIYDRWGIKVFESSDQNSCWDGTYRGMKLEDAVFAYTLEAVLQNGEKIQKRGNISLVK